MKSDLLLVLGIVFLVFAAQTVVSVMVPLAATAVEVDASTIGLLVSIPLAVGMVTDLPLARASDHYGRRPALVAGSTAGVVAAIVLMIGESVPYLIAGSLLVGLALSLLIGPSLAFVTELSTPENHPQVQGFNGAIQGLSALLGAVAVGVLVARIGFQAGFVSVVALMLAVAALTWPIRERSRTRDGDARRLRPDSLLLPYLRAIRMMREEPAMVVAALAGGLYTVIVLVVGNAFVPVYLVTMEGFSGADAGGFLAVRSLVAALTSLTFGAVVARTGMIRLIISANTLGIVGLSLVPVLAQTPLLAGAFVMQGVGIAFGPATSNILVTSATSETERALGFSATQFTARVIGVIMPIVLGISASIAGFGALFLVTQLVGLAMLAAIALLARKAARRGNPAFSSHPEPR